MLRASLSTGIPAGTATPSRPLLCLACSMPSTGFPARKTASCLPPRESPSVVVVQPHTDASNHPERLDEALARPGRFDVTIPFHDSTHGQAVSLFRHFYPAAELQIAPEKAAIEISSLSLEFADTVFAADKLADGSALAVSMAALQGYLLKHKKNPRSAVKLAREWVRELWELQQARVEKKQERIRAREALAEVAAQAEAAAKKPLVEADFPPSPVSPVPSSAPAPAPQTNSTSLHLAAPDVPLTI